MSEERTDAQIIVEAARQIAAQLQASHNQVDFHISIVFAHFASMIEARVNKLQSSSSNGDSSMYGPNRTPEYIQCGPNLEPLEPTPYLEFRSGILHQWFEATCTSAGHGGAVYTEGIWRPVQCNE